MSSGMQFIQSARKKVSEMVTDEAADRNHPPLPPLSPIRTTQDPTMHVNTDMLMDKAMQLQLLDEQLQQSNEKNMHLEEMLGTQSAASSNLQARLTTERKHHTEQMKAFKAKCEDEVRRKQLEFEQELQLLFDQKDRAIQDAFALKDGIIDELKKATEEKDGLLRDAEARLGEYITEFSRIKEQVNNSTASTTTELQHLHRVLSEYGARESDLVRELKEAEGGRRRAEESSSATESHLLDAKKQISAMAREMSTMSQLRKGHEGGSGSVDVRTMLVEKEAACEKLRLRLGELELLHEGKRAENGMLLEETRAYKQMADLNNEEIQRSKQSEVKLNEARQEINRLQKLYHDQSMSRVEVGHDDQKYRRQIEQLKNRVAVGERKLEQALSERNTSRYELEVMRDAQIKGAQIDVESGKKVSARQRIDQPARFFARLLLSYPGIRISFFVYFVLLHLWVLIGWHLSKSHLSSN
eukprot:GHVO01057687.1.p1 GENE.GHVO01057687.1~~GHVO01057687.1.p1  ORF type:complete len:470 (+),score=115.76 GHVO01057687.1:1-1410(+)